MTHLSIKCKSPVWGTHVPLMVMNHVDPTTAQLDVMGFANATVEDHNGRTPADRKALHGGGDGKEIKLRATGPGYLYKIHHGPLHQAGTCYIAEVLRPIAYSRVEIKSSTRLQCERIRML